VSIEIELDLKYANFVIFCDKGIKIGSEENLGEGIEKFQTKGTAQSRNNMDHGTNVSGLMGPD
jgi:hypothetical protein